MFKVDGQYEVFIDGQAVVYSDPTYGSRDSMEKVKTLELHPEDIVVAAYPKSGQTWLSEVIYLIRNGVDVQKANGRQLVGERYKFLEARGPRGDSQIDSLLLSQHPWLIKTHLYPETLSRQIQEAKAKFLVPMRNPKDVLVSWYSFHKIAQDMNYPGEWDDFFDLFKAKKLLFGDVFHHNVSWWRLRHLDHIFIIKYEEMKKDPLVSIQKVAKFLGKELSQEQLQTIMEATSFQVMKQNPATNVDYTGYIDTKKGSFMRKGEVGDWVNFFTDEQSRYVDNLYNEIFLPEGLTFDFE